MEEGEIKIEVRALTGETITVSMSPEKTVNDLKLLLKFRFPPAATSANFHLFFKGVKLSLQSQISALLAKPGEFFVLIPFTKKDKPQISNPSFSETSLNGTKQSSTSKKFSDSTYFDMMQDLSSIDSGRSSNNSDSCTAKARNENIDPSEVRHKRTVKCDIQEGHPFDFLSSLLRSSNKNALKGQNCEKFVEVLKSVNCLSDPHSGKCMLLKETNLRSEKKTCRNNNHSNSSCLCPTWLNRIMETFAFLSIFSSYLHLRMERITLTQVKDALDHLGKFGVQIHMEDVEHLSVICPKVVRFAGDNMDSVNFGDSLVIIVAATEKRDQLEESVRSGQNEMSLSKTFNAMKKWEISFKTNLWEAVKLCKVRRKATSLSLEDLLTFVKECGTFVSGNDAKRTKRSRSSTSSSHSSERRCHDTSQLPPVEMVAHLRAGIGSQGQIVHVEDICARKAAYVEIPNELSYSSKSALKCIGISKLYSHQAESIRASLAGKNVVVATMTSSGKSLCYNIPVLEALFQNVLSCALYLFPTKALAQDQLRALLAMIKSFDVNINVGVYDGDTSQTDRTWLRDNARLVF